MDELNLIKDLINGKLERAPNGFWNSENAKIALRYAILDFYGYTKEDLYTRFNVKDLYKIGLRSVKKYGDIYDLINEAIPEFNLYPWELKKLPNDFWNDDHIKEAVDWLVYEVLDTTPEKAIKQITVKILEDNKLAYLYRRCNRSIKAIFEIAYPAKYFNL